MASQPTPLFFFDPDSASTLSDDHNRQLFDSAGTRPEAQTTTFPSPTPKEGSPMALAVIGASLDTIAPLDDLLYHCHSALCDGGRLWCTVVTSAMKQQRLSQRTSLPFVGRFLVAVHYLWHRVAAKCIPTRWFYGLTTGWHHRSMSRVEIMGRLSRAGFTVQQRVADDNRLWLCATKTYEASNERPHTAAIIRLPRVGKAGRIINVYKLRTMYAYSEFLQEQLYNDHQLATGGKIKHDYRITHIGRWMRRHWIDELPMLLNLLCGNVKLVGVRPLSEHYFHLYSQEMQQLRTRCKPGLLPPFYAQKGDTPETIDDVQENERIYLQDYFRHPLRTDCRYLLRILANILFRHKRSS